MRRAWSCSASALASVDLPTRMGPSTTICRGALNTGSVMALPAPRDHGDDARERVHVARVNHFGGRMRIPQRPAERDIHGAVGNECGAVVAATGDAELHRNL